jgi:hypothetical protein
MDRKSFSLARTQRNPTSGAGGASKLLDSRQPSEFDINEVVFQIEALAQEHGGETSASGPMQLAGIPLQAVT